MSTARQLGQDLAAELESHWAQLGPVGACSRLGLRFQRKGSAVLVCCPWHHEKTPSCSVSIGKHGTIRAHCFACDESWDIHALFAQLNGLDPSSDFPRVLELEAETLNVISALGHRPEGNRPMPPVRSQARADQPEKQAESYPNAAEVATFWANCVALKDDADAFDWLAKTRGFGELLTWHVYVRDLARVLPKDTDCPSWARFRSGKTWADLGFGVIVPMYDQAGQMRALRARRIVPGDSFAKSLGPTGCTTAGLVMADALAREVLLTGTVPEYCASRGLPFRCHISEGEPDFLARAVDVWRLGTDDPWAVLGVISGAWTQAIASRFPDGSTVIVRTHPDAAGEKYAREIHDTLAGRCTVLRGGCANG